jgi:hypothetical protein
MLRFLRPGNIRPIVEKGSVKDDLRFGVSALTPENAHRTRWQTTPWQPRNQPAATLLDGSVGPAGFCRVRNGIVMQSY